MRLSCGQIHCNLEKNSQSANNQIILITSSVNPHYTKCFDKAIPKTSDMVLHFLIASSILAAVWAMKMP